MSLLQVGWPASFKPTKNCPITPLYWAFLERHGKRLERNPRLRMPYRSLARRDQARKRNDRRVFDAVRSLLQRGARLTPDTLHGESG